MQSASLRTNIHFALSKNLGPGIGLQCLSLLVCITYFMLPASQPLFSQIAQFKGQAGVSFAIVSTALFGGLIPVLFEAVWQKNYQGLITRALALMTLWGLVGAMVDALYTFQAQWFGTENSFSVLAKKVMVDQFIFSALLTCPFITVFYVWLDNPRWSSFKMALTKALFVKTIPATVVTNWMIWIPSVTLIYMLPLELQIPLFNLVLCFFALVVLALKRD